MVCRQEDMEMKNKTRESWNGIESAVSAAQFSRGHSGMMPRAVFILAAVYAITFAAAITIAWGL